MRKVLLIAAAIACGVASVAHAEKIGEVSTVFNMMGPNDKIIIEAFDDPKIDGVTCYLSRAKKGGVTGAVGLAEDPSDASIACRQVGTIAYKDKFDPKGEDVFKKSTSWAFKTIQVVRILDAKRNVLTYLVYSDKLIDGSPKNSISVVPVPPGQGQVH
jgi:CreA protein